MDMQWGGHNQRLAGRQLDHNRTDKESASKRGDDNHHYYCKEESRPIDIRERHRNPQSRSRSQQQPRDRDRQNMRYNNGNSSTPREPTGLHETQVQHPQQQHGRQNRRQHPESSRTSSKMPFDENGYCPMHPDICMAKRKARGGWNVRIDQCPKCVHQLSSKRQLSGDTDSLTSEDSREQQQQQQRQYQEQRYQEQHQQSQNRRRNGTNSRGPERRPGRQSSFRSSTNSRNDRPSHQHPQQRSRSRGGGRNRQNPRPSPQQQQQSPRSPSHLDHHCIDFDPNMNCPSPGRNSRGHGDRRRSEHTTRRSPMRPRSLSRSSLRSRGGNAEQKQQRQRSRRRPSWGNRSNKSYNTKIKQRTVCVDGRPFDKSGRCFAHPHVKLASKRILGGWKIHMEFCPLCVDGDYENDDGDGYMGGGRGMEDGHSVISGISHLTEDTGYNTSTSHRSSRRSVKSYGNANANASVSSRRSIRSTNSMKSMSSWSSGHSSKKRIKNRNKKDDSFLPLDEDGYCLNHPNVQLAKISRKGGWRVLMDFCPECAGDSLIIGNNSNTITRKISTASAGNSSCKSGRSSCKSGSSHSTFIESMPYIDGDGKPGHYTGHVDIEGQPNGRGLMKYINGSKFDGVWHEGTKLHGKKTGKKKLVSSLNTSNKQTSLVRKDTPPTPAPPPTPPPTYPPLHVGTATQKKKKPNGNGRSKSKYADQKLEEEDAPQNPRGRGLTTSSNSGSGSDHVDEEESSNPGTSRRRPRRSLSRLRKKCDEIESLLKGYPSSTKDVKQ